MENMCCPLFAGLHEQDVQEIKTVLRPMTQQAGKEQSIQLPLGCIGVLLQGELQIEMHDIQGNRQLVTSIHAQDIFGEVFAVLLQEAPFSIIVRQDARILWLSYPRMLTLSQHACIHQLLQNLMRLFALKNKQLNRKLELSALRSIKEKVLFYLQDVAQQAHSTSFTIPFDRQQLADYLGVDRSALSRVLSQLKQKGILDYHKNQFHLKL